MTLDQWLLDSQADPVVLFDVHHAGGVRRLSTQPFVTTNSDVPPNAAYDDFIIGGVEIAAKIGSNRAIGSVEFYAMEGEAAFEWVSYTAKIGDISWPASAFYPLSTGVIEQATRPARNKIRLEFSDPAKPLHGVILSEKTGESLTPLALGEVFNATPVLEDTLTLKYRANSIPCAITAVRDNGVPVAGYTDNADGSFELHQSVAGDITCDISQQHHTVMAACNFLSSRKGYPVTETVNFDAFQQAAAVGVYITGTETTWGVITDLCTSIGAFPRFDELGNLDLVYVPHAGNAEMALYADDVWMDGFRQSSAINPANVRLNYRRNWTVQNNLAGAVTPEERDLYSRSSTSIEIDNGKPDELQVIETLLTNPQQAATEANRRGDLWRNRREIWQLDAVLPGLVARLGQRAAIVIADAVTAVGTVISWHKRPDRKSTEVEVLL